MELRHLRYFVTVAEELHFGRAAVRLNLSQPPLSQQIRALEESLNVQLFERTSRRVNLTLEGKVFLEQARLVLAQADKARATMDAAQRGSLGRITIGCVTSAFYTHVPAILREFNRRHPEVQLRCEEMKSAQQEEAFDQRQIQVAFTRRTLEGKDLHIETIAKEKMALVLPSGHARAHGSRVRLRDFANEKFILVPRERASTMYDAIIASCARAGFSPKIVQESNDVHALLALVSAGLGICMLPTSLRHLHFPGVVHRELRAGESDEIELCMTWRRSDPSPLVDAFVKVAREVAKKEAALQDS